MKKLNLVGDVYGELEVIEETEPYIKPNGKRERVWKCKCSCGNVLNVVQYSLRTGNTTSCGCPRLQHGFSNHEFFRTWDAIQYRCQQRNDGSKRDFDDDFLSAYKYCVQLGWRKGLAICRGTKENPDTGDYHYGNIYIDTRSENTRDAVKKDYCFVSPDGVIFKGSNISQFCEEHGLNHGHMVQVSLGKERHHKKWTKG